MTYGFLDVAITPAVRTVQQKLGVDQLWTRARNHRASDRFSHGEIEFIAARDSFYIATVSETGWPYVQHRGGPTGFLKVVDEQTLAFADYRGNRQYISTGNLSADDRACLFLMDYAGRHRLKIYAHVSTLSLDDDAALTGLVAMPEYGAHLERIFRLRLVAFDWNCPQHITRRYTEDEVERVLSSLQQRVNVLEEENARLRTTRDAAAHDNHRKP